MACRKWMTRILKSTGRSNLKKTIRDGKCCPPHWRRWAKFKCFSPAVVSLSKPSHLVPSSKPSSVIPRTTSAGTVEYRCLVCRSEHLSVLFQRRKYKAEAIYLLKRIKVFNLLLSSAGSGICSVTQNQYLSEYQGLHTSLYHPLGQGYVPPAKIKENYQWSQILSTLLEILS